jgi:hypothetical protein
MVQLHNLRIIDFAFSKRLGDRAKIGMVAVTR